MATQESSTGSPKDSEQPPTSKASDVETTPEGRRHKRHHHHHHHTEAFYFQAQSASEDFMTLQSDEQKNLVFKLLSGIKESGGAGEAFIEELEGRSKAKK